MIIHSDGSFYVKNDGIKQAEPIGKPNNRSFQPFSEFKDSRKVASYSISPDLTTIPTPDYLKNNSNKVIICPIDVRNYSPNDIIKCDVRLVEPERYDIIEAIKPSYSKKYLYSHFVPWIVISVYCFNLDK